MVGEHPAAELQDVQDVGDSASQLAPKHQSARSAYGGSRCSDSLHSVRAMESAKRAAAEVRLRFLKNKHQLEVQERGSWR